MAAGSSFPLTVNCVADAKRECVGVGFRTPILCHFVDDPRESIGAEPLIALCLGLVPCLYPPLIILSVFGFRAGLSEESGNRTSNSCEDLAVCWASNQNGGEGGIATVVVEREVRVGERWYVSCLQRVFTISRNRQCLCGF